MGILSPDKTLPESEQASDLAERQQEWDTAGIGDSVNQGQSGITVKKTLPATKSYHKIDPLFEKWVTKHLGSNYVGPHYSSAEEMMEAARRSPINGISYMGKSSGGGGGSFRQRQLTERGLLNSEGDWNQEAVANEYKKEQAIEAATAMKVARKAAFDKIAGTLPTPSAPAPGAGADSMKKASYWKEYYDLPPEARGMLQPGVKKAYYDIVDKALKGAGL